MTHPYPPTAECTTCRTPGAPLVGYVRRRSGECHSPLYRCDGCFRMELERGEYCGGLVAADAIRPSSDEMLEGLRAAAELETTNRGWY